MSRQVMGPDGQIYNVADDGAVTPVNQVNPAAAAQAAIAQDFENLTSPEQAIVAFRSRTRSAALGTQQAMASVMDTGSQVWNETLNMPFGLELSTGDELRESINAERARITDPGAPSRELSVANVVGGAPIDMAFSRFGFGAGVAGDAGLAALEAPPGERGGRATEAAAGAVIGEGFGRTLGYGVDYMRGVVNRGRAMMERGIETVTELLPERSAVDINAGKPKDILARQNAVAAELNRMDVVREEMALRGSAEWTRLRDRADYLGFRTTPAMRSGNPQRAQVEAALSRNPLTSGPFIEIAQENERTLARYLTEALGVSGDSLDENTLALAQARIQDGFDSVADALGDDVFADNRAMKAKLSDLLWNGAAAERLDMTIPGDLRDRGPANVLATNISQALQGSAEISGRDLMKWRSDMIARMRNPATDASSRWALGDQVDALDGVIQEVAGGEVGALYRDNRLRYRLFQAIAGASQSTVDQAGAPSARRLAATLRTEYPDDFRLGGLTGFEPARSQAEQAIANAFDAVRVGSTVLYDAIPNSGTPTGMFVNQILSDASAVPSLGLQALGGRALSRTMLAAPAASVEESVSPLITGAVRSVSSAAAEREE